MAGTSTPVPTVVQRADPWHASALKVRPIIFSEAMARAILDGRKSVTRRVMKPQPSQQWHPSSYGEVHKWVGDELDPDQILGWGPSDADGMEAYASPYGQPGDVLYVRERCWLYGVWKEEGRTSTGRPKRRFVVDESKGALFENPGMDHIACWGGGPGWSFRPSIHMPKRHARLWLRVTDVRVERLQEITEADARAEGYDDDADECWRHFYEVRDPFIRDKPQVWFRDLWNDLNADRGYGWDQDPYVWVVEFKRTDAPGA